VDTLAIIKTETILRSAVFALLLVVAGCTTANQQALGVGLEPSTTTATASSETHISGEPTTQTALAPTSGELQPSATAAAAIAAPQPTGPTLANVGFLPITGAPQSAVATLSKALGASSKLHNIGVASAGAITGAGGQSAVYQMKGYMSALNEGSKTTVTFYWDVLDRSGKRLYRINGFEQESGAKKDPWQGVSERTMQRIASRTMGSFANWVKRRGA